MPDLPRTGTALLAIALIITLSSYTRPASAQNAGVQNIMTGAGELTVALDISFPERKDVATVFTIMFSDPSRGEVEGHVYYDFLILKDGKNIFRAATHGGTQAGVIHSVTGIEKQFFTFGDTGSYTARIVIYGLKMVWIEPVGVDFAVTVTPEFQVVTLVLALAAGGIFCMDLARKRLKAFH